VFTVVANSCLLVVTNPPNKEPSTTNKISVARGRVRGGTRPPWEKSRRAMEIPRVLWPGNWAANAGVTNFLLRFWCYRGWPSHGTRSRLPWRLQGSYTPDRWRR
jgi:hypothetical protein